MKQLPISMNNKVYCLKNNCYVDWVVLCIGCSFYSNVEYNAIGMFILKCKFVSDGKKDQNC